MVVRAVLGFGIANFCCANVGCVNGVADFKFWLVRGSLLSLFEQAVMIGHGLPCKSCPTHCWSELTQADTVGMVDEPLVTNKNNLYRDDDAGHLTMLPVSVNAAVRQCWPCR